MQRTQQRTSADHTGNDGVDERGRGTTMRTVHDKVPPGVRAARRGHRATTSRMQTNHTMTTRTYTMSRLCAGREQMSADEEWRGAARHKDRRELTRRNEPRIAAKDNAHLVSPTFNGPLFYWAQQAFITNIKFMFILISRSSTSSIEATTATSFLMLTLLRCEGVRRIESEIKIN